MGQSPCWFPLDSHRTDGQIVPHSVPTRAERVPKYLVYPCKLAAVLLPAPQLRELPLDLLRIGRNTVRWLKESGDLASPPNSASESLLA